jgi:hypothetical protein
MGRDIRMLYPSLLGRITMIESLLVEITERGWHVYSLRDCADSRLFPWEVTLRCPALSLVAYGQGTTLALALSMAIDGIDRAEPHTLPTFTYGIEPRVDLRSIMNRIQPAVKINRRSL